MRRTADDSFALILPQTVLASAPAPTIAPITLAAPITADADPSAVAATRLVPLQGLFATTAVSAFTAAKPSSAADKPSFSALAITAATDPFPTPTDPFPTPKDPFPTPTDPFPTPADPFPTPTNPFEPAPSPGPSPGPVAPVPQPGPPGGNYTITLAELDQSDVAVNGPAARSTGLSGAGVKVGIISNSFNVTGGAAADDAQGLLPASGVTVIQEGPAGSDDEGRAMAELVHATAPGAQLYFATADGGIGTFAADVTALQNAGCQVIVDDVQYPDEPMFQQAGLLDTAINAAVAGGVDYFSAAGNNADAAYQAACAPVSVAIPGINGGQPVLAQTFGGATTQTITALAGSAESLWLEWNAPYDAINSDPITVEVLQDNTVVAISQQIASEPVVGLDLPTPSSDTTYNLAILYNSGVPVPGVFKYELQGNLGVIDNTAGGEATGAVYGHQMLPNINAVGAVDVTDTPSQGGTLTPEPFSNSGGSDFLLAPDGTPLASPEPSPAPVFLAPDGSDTSTLDPFFGTSAAAPVAAAVAALMLQADPSLATTDVTALEEDSALPTVSVDDSAGAGLIQATLATQFASTGVISGSEQSVIRGISQACTIVGGAGDHWLIAGSGATEIESQGVDSVQAGAGADTVDLTGAQAAVYGSTGATWVRTLGGNDTVVGGTGVLTVSGGAGGGIIYGSTSGGNQLTAGAEPTTILSIGTGDLVAGAGSGDILYALGLGNDTVVGGAGMEILVGGTIAGATDTFEAGGGMPLIAPEASNAVVQFGTSMTTALAGTGSDVFQVTDGQAGGFDIVYNFNPASDMLLLSDFGSEESAAQTAIANQYDTGGDSWIKLPDGTLLAFVGLSHLSASNVSYG